MKSGPRSCSDWVKRYDRGPDFTELLYSKHYWRLSFCWENTPKLQDHWAGVVLTTFRKRKFYHLKKRGPVWQTEQSRSSRICSLGTRVFNNPLSLRKNFEKNEFGVGGVLILLMPRSRVRIPLTNMTRCSKEWKRNENLKVGPPDRLEKMSPRKKLEDQDQFLMFSSRKNKK